MRSLARDRVDHRARDALGEVAQLARLDVERVARELMLIVAASLSRLALELL